MVAKMSSPNMTSQIRIVSFPLQRGHFWFVFVKLSEIVGFPCLRRRRSHKTYFKESILLHDGIADFLIKVFRQKKIVQISLHLTFKMKFLSDHEPLGLEDKSN